MKPKYRFMAACAHSKGIISLATLETEIWRGEPFFPENRHYFYVEQKKPQWEFELFKLSIACISPYTYKKGDIIRNVQIFISAEGHVEFVGREEDFMEKIHGAGLWCEDALGLGYMNAIRQIGDGLYACGTGGQIYGRMGPNNWLDISDGHLEKAIQNNKISKDDNSYKSLVRYINGPSEDDIYIVCGDGSIYWKGKSDQWTHVEAPLLRGLSYIYVEDKDNIWICGGKGGVLRGNQRNGFVDLSDQYYKQLFTGLTKYNDLIYIATATGILYYDGVSIKEVHTGLEPEIANSKVIQSVDGVLWSIGTYDIARFDGEKWERIPFPDNLPPPSE